METLISGIISITIPQIIMMVIGAVLMYLGIKKEYEPTLLIPMGLGTLLVNFPGTGVLTQVINGVKQEGIFDILFKFGINTELFPLLIFIGIGAMIDFGPLLQNPFMLLFGASWLATKIDVGPSAAPIIPIEAASLISKPAITATTTTKKIPN